MARTMTWMKRVASLVTIQEMMPISREAMVKGTEMRSARRTTGALDAWAEATRSMIFWYWESCGAAVTRMVREDSPLMDPDRSLSPARACWGKGSPLIMDTLSSAASVRSWPSAGTVSPGRTRRVSPMRTFFTPTVFHCLVKASEGLS